MTHAEQIAGPAATTKTGVLALLRGLLGGKGTGAPAGALLRPSALRAWLAVPLIAVLFALAFTSVASAETLQPWWHLTAEPVPTNLNPANARNEVLELSVTATGGDVLWFYSPSEPFAVFPYNASALEVQAALEGIYGKRSVEVTGGPVVKGTGDLSAATGMGSFSEKSTEVTVLATEAGAFAVGQEISGSGIPEKTTITKIVGSTLTLSAETTETQIAVELHAASNVVTGVHATEGAFAVAQQISGPGIPLGTTIEKVEPGVLTLSQLATEAGTGVELGARVPYTITIKGRAVPFEEIQTNAGFANFLCFIHPTPGCVPPPKLEGSVGIIQKAEGRADGEIRVTATNLGDASASGATEPITVSDVVPAGFEAVAVSGDAFEGILAHLTHLSCSLAGENGVAAPACSFAGSVPPYTSLTLRLQVDAAGASEGEADRASVSGGGARPLSVSRKIPLGETTPFGISDYELVNEDEGGGADTQAGSHPFQQTTTVIMNQILDARNGFIEPAVLPKDLHFLWPAGLVGNPASLPQCPPTDFDVAHATCPADTAVGVAKALVTFNQGNGAQPFAEDESLFNLVPAPGEPARFGFIASGVPVYIDPSVRSGRDYGITVSSDNISELAGFRSVEVSVWGSPGAASHDQLRGEQCVDATTRGVGSCVPTPIEHGQAFLSLPTSCPVNQATGRPEPLVSTVTGDTWLERRPTDEQPQLAEYVMPAMDGCDALPFKPSIVVTPDGHEASKPTGLNVDVHVPQQETLNPEGLSEADPKDITVTLPEGVAVNPSSGDGLQACSEALVGFTGSQELFKGSEPGVLTPTFKGFKPESIAARTAIEGGEAPAGEGTLEPGLNFCSNASKIGEVTIKTPLLPPTQPLTGSVYLATQNQNPFGSLIALYLIAEDPVSGTLVRIAGQTHLSPTGQLTTTFEDSPQAPFEDAELHFFGGERAPLTTPAHCRENNAEYPGEYTTNATFTPWSGNEPTSSSSSFKITEGPNHSPCPGASLPFSPSFTGGMTNINAGSFSPLTTTISRPDGQQNLQSVTLHMPPGFAGLLSSVKLCPEAQANEGMCGPESLIGETIVSAGVGFDPVSVTGGKVYLTEHYAGAPFGLSIVNPVKAGPFDLEHDTSNPSQNPACDCVVVRAKIEVNPVTAEETITTDPSGSHAIPHLIDGIPVQIKAVNVLINREHFTFNPTNCNPMSLTGSIASDEGASSPLSVPFQVTNCAILKYEPKVAVSTVGKASKAGGASLSFKISYPKNALGSQSWMKEMKFDIPKQLPARLTTIQKACLAATFETNRSACPAASIIGHVLVHTPVLPVPLEGPLYFVSYGGAAFPDAVAVIKGYGVTIESHGHTFINHKTGVTSATFESVPDVPFESIEVSVPQGPFSEFGANLPHEGYNFCGQKLAMPILFKAQNGLEIHQNIPMAITGCHILTNKQKLAAALKACHKKHNKSKRHTCEKAARRTYGAKTSKKKK